MVNSSEIGALLAAGVALTGQIGQWGRSWFQRGKREQREADVLAGSESAISELKLRFDKHEDEAKSGYEAFNRLKAGMSDGAAASFGRVEHAIEGVLAATTENGKQIAALTGQVTGLTKLIDRLVTKVFNGG